MQISKENMHVQLVSFDFFHPQDLRMHRGKFYNSTPECSDQPLSLPTIRKLSVFKQAGKPGATREHDHI